MNYFAQAIEEINDECLYKKLPYRTKADTDINSQLMSLEEAMSTEFDTYSAVLEKLSSIEEARQCVIEDVGQLKYASAEEKLSGALVLCNELFSMEDVGQNAQAHHVASIDVSNRLLLRAHSAEAINFIDTAIKIGKLIIKKIVEFILYIFRLIVSISKRVWGKLRSKGKVEYKITKPTGLAQDGTPIDVPGGSLPLVRALGYDESDGDAGMVVDHTASISFSIPTEFAATLWDYSERRLATNGKQLLRIIGDARGDLCKVLHSSFMNLSDCTLNEYYSIVNFIYRGRDAKLDGATVREIMASKGEARMKNVELAINKAFSDCLNIPKDIEGKVIYPGVVFSTPNYKKSNSMSSMIKIVETDKVKAVKEAATNKFIVAGSDELLTMISRAFDLINTMGDISDECESRIDEIQKRLEEVVEVSSSESGRANFMKFYSDIPRIHTSNPSAFVNAYNAAVLQNLRLIAKQQLDVIMAVSNLASGIGDGQAKGILQIAMDHYNAMGVEFTVS